MTTTDQTLHSAVQAVGDACRVARTVQARLDDLRHITKDDRSPVTVADFAVQAIVSLALQEADANVRIVGEEHAGVLRDASQTAVRDTVVEAVQQVYPAATAQQVLDAIDHCDHDATSESYWTLDPVDGTKGFLRGQQYAIALALLERGEVTLGVMGCPNLPIDPTAPLDVADQQGVLYSATKHGGTWQWRGLPGAEPNADAVRIITNDDDDPQTMRTCESVEKSHSKQRDTERIIERLGVESDPVRLDSQCKYAVVARGQADAYLRMPTKAGYRENIWDHAAGMLIATEAGAVVTDITGTPLDFTHGQRLERNRGVICAAPAFHGRIIEAIEQLGIGASEG